MQFHAPPATLPPGRRSSSSLWEENMTRTALRNVAIGALVIGILSICAAAQGRNVSGMRHPNLAAAQTLIEKAMNKVSAAQAANEFDMDGHAAKAKELLGQAYAEIKLAAQTANVKK